MINNYWTNRRIFIYGLMNLLFFGGIFLVLGILLQIQRLIEMGLTAFFVLALVLGIVWMHKGVE